MPLTENQKQSRYNYAKKALKRIPLDVQKEKYEEIKAAAPSSNEQQAIPDQPVISSTAVSGNTSQKPCKPFTKKAAEQIDTGKLLNDFRYQLDIGLVYGNDVLTRLLNEARQQSAE